MSEALSLALAALIAAPGTALAAPRRPRLHVEVFGTRSLDAAELERRFSEDLLQYLRTRSQRRKSAAAEADAIRLGVERKVLAMGDFVWAQLDLEETAQGEERDAYFIFNVVERKDRAARLPFRPKPLGSYGDPAGLLQAWAAYTEEGARLVRRGEVGVQAETCAAFHCPWGASSPQLKAMENRFVADVPANREELEKVFLRDADASRRTHALYLLAYLKDGVAVVDLSRQGLADPDERVREAALRVLGDVALRHPEVPVPIDALTAVLAYPGAADRTRALAVVLSLADKPTYRPFLILNAGRHMLSLLRLSHPNSHQLAHAALGLLSGESHGERDYDAWENWWSRARVAVNAGKVPAP